MGYSSLYVLLKDGKIVSQYDYSGSYSCSSRHWFLSHASLYLRNEYQPSIEIIEECGKWSTCYRATFDSIEWEHKHFNRSFEDVKADIAAMTAMSDLIEYIKTELTAFTDISNNDTAMHANVKWLYEWMVEHNADTVLFMINY